MRARRRTPGRLAVDSCAGEFEARTPYYYLSYEAGDGDETPPARSSCSARARTGSARGSSSTTAACRRAQAFRRLGHEVVLVNSNPETVSTDYDTCDRLYLEPVTLERVLDVVELERPLGVVVVARRPDAARARGGSRRGGRAAARRPARRDRRRGGSRPLRRAARGARRARPGLGVRRRRPRRRARSRSEIGYPVLVRPSYVLGGRGMRVARRPEELELDGPALVDRFLEGALELDVDVLCDGEDGWVAAILEHVERAGVHSGDSACVLPGALGRPGARDGDPRARVAARRRPRRARAAQPPARAARRASCTCSRRTRARRARFRSSPRRRGSRSSTTPAGCCSARRSASSTCRSASCRRAPGRRRRSSPPSASPAPPTAASRCARPAR